MKSKSTTGNKKKSQKKITKPNIENEKIDSVELEEILTVNQEILNREVSMRKDRRRVRAKYISMVLVLFVVFAAMIYRYSIVIEINNMTVKSNTELNDIRNKADILKKEISKETDLEKIRILAESRLHMQKPDTHQYIYIKVPRKDHALLNSDLSNRQEQYEKVSFRDRINEVIERLWFKF